MYMFCSAVHVLILITVKSAFCHVFDTSLYISTVIIACVCVLLKQCRILRGIRRIPPLFTFIDYLFPSHILAHVNTDINFTYLKFDKTLNHTVFGAETIITCAHIFYSYFKI